MEIFQKKQDYFALSFSDYQLQLAKVDSKGRLRHYSENKLEPGVIVRGQIKNQETLRGALAALLKAAKLKHKFVVIGLPEVRAFTRVFNLPPLSIEELDDAVRWESESLLPFPLSKAYLDWMILEETKEWVRALVVALPQDLVEDYAQLLEGLGFQPIAFEITSLSLARLVGRNKTASLVIEVKEKEAVLVVVGAEGGIEVSSTIFFQDEREAIEETCSTVKNLLSFYRKKIGEEDGRKKVTQILFCGGGANEGLVSRIGQETNISSAILNIEQAHLASVISLAQKDVAAPIDEKTINLIPPRIQGIYDQAARVREVSTWLKFALFCLFLVLFGYSVAVARVYFEIKKIEGKIIELQAVITSETKETEEKAKSLNSRAQKIVALIDSRPKVSSLLTLVQQATPEGILVTHCFFDGQERVFFINGVASSRDKLLAFREALERTGKFSRVHIPLSSLEKEANVNFTISTISQ